MPYTQNRDAEKLEELLQDPVMAQKIREDLAAIIRGSEQVKIPVES